MGIFKKIKKVGILKAAAIAAATYFGGPIGGAAAASVLLKKKAKKPEEAGMPTSPFEGVSPVTQDAALRAQQTGQQALAGGLASSTGQEGEDSLMEEDEIKKRRASRMLLG